MGWIRIRMDPELLHGSGTRKLKSWIRIRNTSFQIHNTVFLVYFFIPDPHLLMRIRIWAAFLNADLDPKHCNVCTSSKGGWSPGPKLMVL